MLFVIPQIIPDPITAIGRFLIVETEISISSNNYFICVIKNCKENQKMI